MCLLIDGEYIMTGWGCCSCKTYNGLWRDDCKICGRTHCPIGTAETDILDAAESHGDPPLS